MNTISRKISSVRSGFTLAEVAFALSIMVAAVVTVMLLLASTQRTQQKARIGIYAAAIATDMMSRFATPTHDFRGGQNYNSPSGKTFLESRDGDVYRPSIKPRAFFGNRSGFEMYGHKFKPDLEIAMLKAGVIVPVPEEIARRLDSPGNAISELLDRGGSLYYVHPNADIGGQAYGMGDRGGDRARQQLLVGIVGEAQQNVLPGHPVVAATRALYPFPPQFQNFTSNSNSQTPIMFPYKWDYGLASGGTAPNFTGTSMTAGDLQTELPSKGAHHSSGQGGFFSEYASRAQLKGGDEQGTWEDQAYMDEMLAVPGVNPNIGTQWADALSGANDWSPWRAGLPELHRLMWWHWNRLYHQTRSWNYSAGSYRWTWEEPQHGYVDKEITELVVEYDEFRNPTVVERTRTIKERVQTGVITRTGNSSRSRRYRGVPNPPIGLPMMQGARGTDILYEDAETLATDRWNQMRVGLPGLERRVMYRTAALALWGKVDGHGTITEVSVDNHPDPYGDDDGDNVLNHVDPDDMQHPLNNPSEDGNPNIIELGALPLSRNPLLTIIPPPSNPNDIHPAQVYALSHLAHAAMKVTGYKPPFVDWNNTLDTSAHTNLVSDEDLPYKAATAPNYFLFHPFYVKDPSDPTGDEDGDGTINSSDSDTTMRYYQGRPLADKLSEPLAVPLEVGVIDVNDPRIARDMEGNPIVYKRVDGDVLNPFPGPYADRGAFNWRGEAFWARDDVEWSGGGVVTPRGSGTLTITDHGAFTMRKSGGAYNVTVPAFPAAGSLAADAENALVSDTDMARIAMENCLAWAMAFTSANPYDLRAPRPANIPTSFHRPLFAWDIFSDGGDAKRPRSDWDNVWDFYKVAWGTDRAAWPTQYSAPTRPWSFWSMYYNKGTYLDDKQRYSPLTTQFGPDTTADGTPDPFATDPHVATSLPYSGQYLNPHGLGYLSYEMNRGHSRSFNAPPGKHGMDFRTWREGIRSFNIHQGAAIMYYNNGTGTEAEWRMNTSANVGRFWYDTVGGGITGRTQPVAADRTRQLVFWAVDWMAFEDAESLPSETMDLTFWGGTGLLNDNSYPSSGHPERALMWANPVRDATHWNPPRDNVQFTRWADNSGNQLGNRRWADMRTNHLGSGIGMTNIFYTTNDALPWAKFGTWGADRNGNGVWDKGRVPPSSRMMAEEVARFPFYDTVLHTTIGN